MSHALIHLPLIDRVFTCRVGGRHRVTATKDILSYSHRAPQFHELEQKFTIFSGGFSLQWASNEARSGTVAVTLAPQLNPRFIIIITQLNR